MHGKDIECFPFVLICPLVQIKIFPARSKAALNLPPYTEVMKKLLPAMLAVALSAIPLGAIAGELAAPVAPSMPGMSGPPPEMAQMDAQMRQLHIQARSAMLQAISAQHRQLLAQIVGNLAISPNPDFAGATKQLDAALSAQEAQAVVRIQTQFHQQMDQLMQAHIRQMESSAGHEAGAPQGQTRIEYRTDGDHQRQIDPGECLLMLANPGMGMMHHMMIDKTVTH
jgi:hypothetical protein